ncbi:MAG: porin [Planctomycetia bacterium]|nr:porin [Planctomycetia bacterium]
MIKVDFKKAAWRLVNAGALLAVIGLSTVQGQDARGLAGRRHPVPAHRVVNHDMDEDDDDILQVLEEEVGTPPPGVAPPADTMPTPPANDKETPPEEPPAPWTLTNLFDNCDGSNAFKDCGVKISGHMQWGYQDKPDGAFTGNGPFVNQKEWGMLALNQQYLFIEKVADGSKGWGWGFRVDGMYGVDGNEGQAFGNINAGHWDYLNGLDHSAYEYAVPQAYGELAYDKLSVKLGHFYTIVGYEVIPSTGQFFYSRQLTFWNSEPFTHTGALGTYKVTDKFSVLGGWVAGMDTGFYMFNGGSSFLGGFSWTISDKATLAYSMIGGNLGWRGNGGAINSGILSLNWTKKFSTVHQFDVLDSNLTQLTQTNVPGAPATFVFNNTPANFRDPASFTPRASTGFINYAFYELTDKIKAGVRLEWYKPDGDSHYTATAGFNYKPFPYLIIRPEVRGMWSPANQDIYTGAGGFSGKLFNQTVFGIDAIITF